MVEEVRELSLHDVGIRPGSYERGVRNRNRDGSRDTREEDARQQRRREQDRRRRADGHDTSAIRNHGPSSASDSRSQARQIEHQSSLRSLLSSSDIDSSEMEEEILRQIMDEGLLDGIDLNNIDVSQEDELSERIADAYRRRHGGNPRSRNTQAEEPRSTSTSRRAQTSEQAQPQRRHHRRTSSAADQVPRSSHPPISRPHLLEAYPIPQTQRRRTSSERRRQTSPAASTTATRVSSDTLRQVTQSATDLSTRTQSTVATRPRPADLPLQSRRDTATEHRRPRAGSRDRTPQSPQPMSPRGIARPSNATVNGPVSEQLPTPTPATVSTPTAVRSPTTSEEPSHSRTSTVRDTSREIPSAAPRPSSSSSTPKAQPVLYPEPSIRCNRCGKSNIEYELHLHCSTCNGGNYNICLRCYRSSRGCLYWYGFGLAASEHYLRQAPPAGYPPNHPLPHQLQGHRFLRPISAISQHPTPENRNPSRTTPEDPAKRLQSGVFCSKCSAFANECFWKCDDCNEGEWGFCNSCVNQSKCCTHSLLPVAHRSSVTSRTEGLSSPQQSDRSLATSARPRRIPANFHPSGIKPLDTEYIPLTFSPNCKICTYPIQPSNTRFHCPQCNEGDYDICTTCYLKLVATGKISKSNGDKGWRKCLEGHRMVVVGFEDSPLGQRRTIVRDRVGGNEKKKLAQMMNMNVPMGKYPPDGGAGIRFFAVYSFWPQDGDDGDLAFPRGAEIREAEKYQGEWYVGCYAGSEGIFPLSYVEYRGMVTMP